MNEQTKQKVLVGFLAVLIIGAGSFWYMGRDTSSSNVNYASGPTQRRQRVEKEVATKDIRKRSRKEPARAKVTERRERAASDKKKTSRRTRKRSQGKKVKKEKLVPAS